MQTSVDFDFLTNSELYCRHEKDLFATVGSAFEIGARFTVARNFRK